MSTPNVFTYSHKVRFGECDAAGIVFYPRYFEIVNDVQEEFFSTIGYDYKTLHLDMNKSIPTVHLEANFSEASMLNDVLDISLNVTKIGRTSMTLKVSMHCNDSKRFETIATVVYLNQETMKSESIPTDMREKLENYLLAEDI